MQLFLMTISRMDIKLKTKRKIVKDQKAQDLTIKSQKQNRN
jgi:hypothetical protein